MQRKKGTATWDNLTYVYDNGNRLTKVTDAGSTEGFNNGSSADTEDYKYDGNANTVQDKNRGIADGGIRYNMLNLPREVAINSLTMQYYYDATGSKLRMQRGTENTKYAGIFEYNSSNYLTRIGTNEGQITITNNGTSASDYSFEYYRAALRLKDHLGNTRQVINEAGTLLQETEYFPFGLAIPRMAGTNKYTFLGKERQAETNWIDLQARFYDPTIGRFMVVDPMAEKRYWLTPYNYAQNNPILRIDPKGLTDYKFNQKTGEIAQVGEKKDSPDRILRTNNKGEVKYRKNGEAKVAIDGIEKGILMDGQNFKNRDQVISVGGTGQPSASGVKSFTLQLSEYVGKEIKGYSYSSNGSGSVTDMVLGKYVNNEHTKSTGNVRELMNKYGASFSNNNILQEFHTHPDGKLGATQSAPGLSQDVTGLQGQKPLIPNASFIILYRIPGQIQPGEYDYTHEYRNP